MKETYSYADCYKILNTSQDQSFKEIRKAYKRNIQKFHPDRLDDSQKEAANDKIKQLSIAFSTIEKHYKEHGNLPAIFTEEQPPHESAATPPPTDKSENREYTEYNKQSQADTRSSTTSQHPPINKPTSRKPFLFVLISCATLVFFYLDNSTETEQPPANEELKTIKPTTNNTITTKSKDTPTNKKKMPEFFTIGSPIGEVIDVQGKPDKTLEDVWFYGKSKVIFKDGVVFDWKRGKGSPIKARLIIESNNNLPPNIDKQHSPSSLTK